MWRKRRSAACEKSKDGSISGDGRKGRFVLLWYSFRNMRPSGVRPLPRRDISIVNLREGRRVRSFRTVTASLDSLVDGNHGKALGVHHRPGGVGMAAVSSGTGTIFKFTGRGPFWMHAGRHVREVIEDGIPATICELAELKLRFVKRKGKG